MLWSVHPGRRGHLWQAPAPRAAVVRPHAAADHGRSGRVPLPVLVDDLAPAGLDDQQVAWLQVRPLAQQVVRRRERRVDRSLGVLSDQLVIAEDLHGAGAGGGAGRSRWARTSTTARATA